MPLIHFPTLPSGRFILRQTPKGDGVWQDFRFVFDLEGEAADWLVVQDAPPPGLVTAVPRHRRIVILAEPKSIRRYDEDFVRQFGIALAPTLPDHFDGVTFKSHSAVPWFYGVDLDRRASAANIMDFDSLAQGRGQTENRGLLSAVCSTKTLNRNQIRRLRFLTMLQGELGDQLAVFGRGFKRIGDKAEGLDGFRYHLVLENNLDPHGWTEKLADPLLAGVYPIVAGGPGLDAYFHPGGFTAIDTRRPKQAVKQVLEVLERDPASLLDVQAAMADNKRRLMGEHQIFPLISRIVRELPQSSDHLPAPVPIHGPRKSRLRHLVRPIRLLRAPLDKLYLEIFE